MAEDVRIWRIDAENGLREIVRSTLDLEARIEAWLEQDIAVLDPGLLVIGRQVETDFGGIIDLLCLNAAGDVVVVELKRDRTPREITAQILDYASWVSELSPDRVSEIAQRYLRGRALEDAFQDRFGAPLPDALNERHRLLIVASRIDPSSERIVRYLSSTHGVDINAVTFHYYRQSDGPELLARLFLIAPEQVSRRSQADGQHRRRPNLTLDELSALAGSSGVAQMYDCAVAEFGPHFQTHTTRSSLVFSDRRKAVLSLIPGESSPSSGLRFRVYIRRLQAAFSLTEAAALAALPNTRSPWIYYETAGPDYEGFEGFFANEAEILRLVEALQGDTRKAA